MTALILFIWRLALLINLIDDESSTNYKLKKKRKKENKNERYERNFKTQNARDSKYSKCAAWSALFITKLTVIISKSSHYFAKVSSLFDATRNLDDASFWWRELSTTNVESFSDLRMNKIFITLFFSLDHQIFWFDFCFSQFDFDLSKYLS